MPNIATHLRISREVLGTNDPEPLLGSALPDFIGMYRNATDNPLPNVIPGSDALIFGQRFHHTTDRVFDRQLVLRELTVPVRAVLAPVIGRGAALMCAGPWTDVTLDGVLFEMDRESSRLFEDVADAVCSDKTSLTNFSDGHFVDFVKSYFDAGVPRRYSDPHFLATSIHRRLQSRNGGKMGFSDEHIPLVRSVFAEHITRVKPLAEILLRQTVCDLRAEGFVERRGGKVFDVDGVNTGIGLISGVENSIFGVLGIDNELRSQSIAARLIIGRLVGQPPHELLSLNQIRGSGGSISHARTGLAAGAVSVRDGVAVGIDVERLEGKVNMARRVMTPDEISRYGTDGNLDRIFASMKEAAYKSFAHFCNDRYVAFNELELEYLGVEGGAALFDGRAMSSELQRELAELSVRAYVYTADQHIFALATTCEL